MTCTNTVAKYDYYKPMQLQVGLLQLQTAGWIIACITHVTCLPQWRLELEVCGAAHLGHGQWDLKQPLLEPG